MQLINIWRLRLSKRFEAMIVEFQLVVGVITIAVNLRNFQKYFLGYYSDGASPLGKTT
jgi:hypothetical protein